MSELAIGKIAAFVAAGFDLRPKRVLPLGGVRASSKRTLIVGLISSPWAVIRRPLSSTVIGFEKSTNSGPSQTVVMPDCG